MTGGGGPAELPALLVRHRGTVLALVTREAGGLLRYESAEDLVQGVHLRALERGASFDYRGEEAFLGWIRTVARTFLSDRRAHWSALKRRSGRMLRYTAGAGEGRDSAAVPEPAAARTGPSTFADRRERILRVVRTLDALLPRDRDLVRWTAEDVPLGEMAGRLGITYDAAERARLRALERFRKAFRLGAGA